MSRVLFDRNVPVGLRRQLPNHRVSTTDDEGWSTLANGDLLDAAERSGFDVMVTADLQLKHQQNLSGRRLALVVLSTSAWPVVRTNIPAISTAVDAATPGSYRELTLLRPQRPSRLLSFL